MQKNDILLLQSLKQTYKDQFVNRCSMMYIGNGGSPSEYRLSTYSKFKLAMFRSSYYKKYGLELSYIYSPRDISTLLNRSRFPDSEILRDMPLLIYDNLCKKYDYTASVEMIHQLAGIESGKLTVNEYIEKITRFMGGTVERNYTSFNTPIDSERQREATYCIIKSIDFVLTDTTTWKWRENNIK